MVSRTPASRSPAEQEAWDILAGVPDPELPMLSVVDLGIVRSVRVAPDVTPDVTPAAAGPEHAEVTITPTYSGCPAMRAIESDIRSALAARFDSVQVRTTLHPAWTTEWISPAGRDRLAAAGIAPPHTREETAGRPLLTIGHPAACPHCGSPRTGSISRFGSTACLATYRCQRCREPFSYLKQH